MAQTVVSIRKFRLPVLWSSNRPRTDECVAVWYADGTGRRYEFDYDGTNIYVYSNTCDASGRMTPGGYTPVRSIPWPNRERS